MIKLAVSFPLDGRKNRNHKSIGDTPKEFFYGTDNLKNTFNVKYIDSRKKPSEKVKAIIDSLGADASEVNFVSMAAFPKNNATKLVKVRAIEGRFPFYGDLTTDPKNAGNDYQELGGTLVDATLMLQYNLNPGDSIKLGKVTFPIIGALKSIPGSTAISSSIAPSVLIPFRFLEKTALL